MRFFIDEPETVREGTKLLPTLAIAVVFCAMTYLMNTVFQATGRKFYSLLTSMMRKGIFDIPLMFLFKRYLHETGIVIATPTAEVLSIFVSLFLLLKFLKSLKKDSENA
jgi:Na+-driven multidrug efflux pump